MTNKVINKRIADEIMAMYREGIPIDTIRSAYGVTRKQIGKIVTKGDLVPINVKDVVRKYTSGEPLDRIGVAYCVDSSVIRDTLEDAGIEVRSHGEHSRVYDVNHDFFKKIDTEEKAYWLGFIYADGNIDQRMSNLNISLAAKDRDQLVKFAKDVGFTGDVTDFSIERGAKVFNYSKIVIHSKRLVGHLYDHGVVPNKSLTIGPPIGLPKHLESHFIRGLWDGDGSVSTPARSGVWVSLVSGSYELLEWVSERMPVVSSSVKIRPSKDIWELRVSSREGGAEWVGFMYDNSTVALERKAVVAEEWREYRV